MGIKVFRIVLDGVVHEVEVEEIHRESRGGGQTAQGRLSVQKTEKHGICGLR